MSRLGSFKPSQLINHLRTPQWWLARRAAVWLLILIWAYVLVLPGSWTGQLVRHQAPAVPWWGWTAITAVTLLLLVLWVRLTIWLSAGLYEIWRQIRS